MLEPFTAALDHIMKLKIPKPKEIKLSDVEVDEQATRLSQIFEDLRFLLEYEACPSPVTPDLAYLGGYIAKLIADLGCDSCAALLKINNRDHPLHEILRAQERNELHYPRPEFLSLLDKIVLFFFR